ncbi:MULTISPECIES: secretin N-terminal domain-containing protein [unclassified Microcystis]|uniref:Pilus assembly protein n=2 Tax=Microcystis TaxID=1125 RepID=A0A552KGH9_9CHRO|nr:MULTISPECIES: secretin N-terminal domain-containing protein [unclassified Microcystis]MCA2816477.1 pilus assembly protein [Microcystis sp. M085S1]MCA2856613.1 pilus assembly protein [Microcystis sp. M065S1]TRT75989.1 MAG: pilus assembly protein [Microcystis flos-aquae Ma_QC_C_20070823_S18]TRT96795.1 MAG: pilus assembly protein [Microcystis flos-aquae Ma_QC_C_20070823_S18D]TRV07096.1 MAG: pilus assembly protein [Microcystis flos-aquae Mf_QC_C_20070823_S10D]TRV25901.1 MAG: pilus assembly pro
MNPSRYALFIPQIASFLLMAPLSVLAETPISFHGSELKSGTSKIEFWQEFSKETLQKSPNQLVPSSAALEKEISDRILASEKLLAQSAPMVPNPEIIIQGVPQAPGVPTLPRAVAPPVGDIAISNIDASAEKVKFERNITVPRVLLREASAREVLMTLANIAGYNVVFTSAQGETNATSQTVSLEFTNESVENIFNAVLLISGLQANRQGKTIFVGAQLPQGARNLISRTLRLNQVKAIAAATFLATQGAEYQRLVTQTEDIVDPLTGRVIGRRDIPPTLEALTPQQTEGSKAALLLTGLRIAADDRLNSINLIGEARQVQIATSLLTQLDARRRQVVVNVKVIDVNLLNTDRFSSSFSFGFNDGFFVQDNGAAVVNFGNMNPPSSSTVSKPGAFAQPIVPLNNVFSGEGTPALEPFFDVQDAPFSNITQGRVTDRNTGLVVPYARPNFGTFNNPFQPGATDADGGDFALPDLFQYPQRFLMTLQASIQTGNAKILTDPSLVVQEGQQATVKLTEKVLESVETSVDPLSGERTTTPVLADAGLTLAVNVDQVDDNGFISLSVSPTIASPGSPIQFNSGGLTINTLTPLIRRELTSGLIRLRDGQSLILSGIIQEKQQSSETKVPILGDIPILGALFRSRTNSNSRSEVIILLTPKIIEDSATSTLGINYQPGQDAAEVLQRQGFPVQPRQ